ncbi:MAG: hypothetical protein IT330_01680, partial [Anaerolineae bacterium]|nr:hypothetical protein [Anaerolineae bacterium]
MVSLLRHLGAAVKECTGPIDVQLQPPALVSRPDAQFQVPNRLFVVFENKIVARTLRQVQIRGHLDLSKTQPSSVHRVILAIAPDQEPPEWWEGIKGSTNQVEFVYGSWRQVFNWAEASGSDDAYGPESRLIFGLLVDYLRQERVVKSASTTFAPEVVRRFEKGTAQWRADLSQQYQVQEAFLKDVASAFFDDLLRRGEKIIPKPEIKSGWYEPDSLLWGPVSSVLEFQWEGTPLPGWPQQSFWVWIYFDTAQPSGCRLILKVGLLLQGAHYVQWFGALREAAQKEFKERLEAKDWGAEYYREVWANTIPFDVSRQDKMLRQAVDDLKRWTMVV